MKTREIIILWTGAKWVTGEILFDLLRQWWADNVAGRYLGEC